MQQVIHDIYVGDLANARALKVQAIQLLSRQVERLESYPELEEALRQLIVGSEGQRDRLDELLASIDSARSALKELAPGIMAARAQTVAPDAVLKNSFANHAFGHFEIAAYKALMAMARMASHQAAAAPLQRSLDEENPHGALVQKPSGRRGAAMRRTPQRWPEGGRLIPSRGGHAPAPCHVPVDARGTSWLSPVHLPEHSHESRRHPHRQEPAR